MDVVPNHGLVVNAPSFFTDPDFIAWLDDPAPKFTWHRGGQPGEWSDVVVLVDPTLNGEGADSDMPAHIWDQIVALCRHHFGPSDTAQAHLMIRLTNLSD